MAAFELIMTITAENKAAMDHQIAEAERIAIARAVVDGTKGIMVTRHKPNLCTVVLSDEVPYGLTRERLLM
ncbi:hypothetical protein PV768_20995 [Pseudarthrobacter sp. CC4]|uniref:hypothetical protein n=1 Tax=unclassified Pseudarthrobacter TaxID=2647000 RepID=UPI0012F9AD9F|nr:MULTISPECIES: hypothetical protein [unclassified Pseudarthrobacter]MEA3550992.1 hypothetical protein [Pseudarthrobacter sp. C1]MUU69633.1 hypothetical protein [Pseudarthrobacter sp. GA104]